MKTLFQRPDQVCEPLHVLTTVFNPIRFRSRWKLYEDFKQRIESSGQAILYTAELAFGHRDFVVTELNNPRHLQLQTKHEIWYKENTLNLLMAKLPLNAKYIAWVDADVNFAAEDWANETIHQLQHYDVVQMWSEAQDLGPNYEVIGNHKSFAACYIHGEPEADCTDYYTPGKRIYWHPGFAWAARRDALDSLGRLIDFCILGSADFHMAYGLIGKMDKTIKRPLHARYKNLLKIWEERAEKHIKHNIGYVPGLILHNWHGAKASRRYQDRWEILSDTKFNPDIDLKYDWQGLFQLTDRSSELRDRVRAYFRSRDEDNNSTEAAWANTMFKRK